MNISIKQTPSSNPRRDISFQSPLQNRSESEDQVTKLKTQLRQECANVLLLQKALAKEREEVTNLRNQITQKEESLKKKMVLMRATFEKEKLQNKKFYEAEIQSLKLKIQQVQHDQSEQEQLAIKMEEQLREYYRRKLKKDRDTFVSQMMDAEDNLGKAENQFRTKEDRALEKIFTLESKLEVTEKGRQSAKEQIKKLKLQLNDAKLVKEGLQKKLELEQKWRKMIIELVHNVISLHERTVDSMTPIAAQYNIDLLKQLADQCERRIREDRAESKLKFPNRGI